MPAVGASGLRRSRRTTGGIDVGFAPYVCRAAGAADPADCLRLHPERLHPAARHGSGRNRSRYPGASSGLQATMEAVRYALLTQTAQAAGAAHCQATAAPGGTVPTAAPPTPTGLLTTRW